jgi:hypothetical protein
LREKLVAVELEQFFEETHMKFSSIMDFAKQIIFFHIDIEVGIEEKSRICKELLQTSALTLQHLLYG